MPGQPMLLSKICSIWMPCVPPHFTWVSGRILSKINALVMEMPMSPNAEMKNAHDSQSQVYQEKGNKGRSDAETLVHQPFGNVRPACSCPVPDLGCLGTHELPERTVEHVALIGCTCKKERDDSQQHENTYESYNHSQDEMEALVFSKLEKSCALFFGCGCSPFFSFCQCH